MTWTTSKNLAQPEGTFNIGLVPRKVKGESTWADLIEPMDYVEIRASATGQKTNGKLPIIMRGFVDSVGEGFAIGATGGPSEPRITIAGRDYSKLLIVWQILYLWTQNSTANMAAYQSGFGLFYNYGLQLVAAPLQQFFTNIFHKMVDPITSGIQQNWMSIPNFRADIELPDYEMSLTPVMSYTGSFFNLFSYFSSPPFGECFVWDDDTSPVLTTRVTPYHSYDGLTPTPGKEIKPSYDLTQIQSYNLSRTDSDLFTYYLTWGDSTQQTQLTMPVFVTAGLNGISTSNQSLFGTRPLIVDSAWVNPFNGSDTTAQNQNAVSVANDLNTWLLAVMQDNQRFKSGNMSVHGNEKYRIGTYANFKQKNEEYYVTSVQHTYTQFQRWDTKLYLTRGRSLGASSNNNSSFKHGFRATP